jgi:hypothetical protein
LRGYVHGLAALSAAEQVNVHYTGPSICVDKLEEKISLAYDGCGTTVIQLSQQGTAGQSRPSSAMTKSTKRIAFGAEQPTAIQLP